MEERFEPVDVEVRRDEGLTIKYADGHVATFDLLSLRLACPCATCRSLRDSDQPSWPRPGSPTPLRIDDAEYHGAWGLSIKWNDGHSTGIFPWVSLRHWSEGNFPFGPDSGLSGPQQ